MSTMRRTAVVAVSLAWLLSCVGLQRNPNVVGTYSDKLSPYNYRDDGLIASIVVGVDAARYVRREPYFPLFVQVANKTPKTVFGITRESFVLEDSLGRQYGVAAAQDVAAHYPRLDLDRRLFQANRSITLTYVNLYTYIESDFFPSSARRSLLLDQVTLPTHAYMEDVLYFPIPDGGLNGTPLRLLFQVKGIQEPIVVTFEVPKTLGILEKDRDGAKDKDAPPGGPPR